MSDEAMRHSPLRSRRAGVLLHPTSLPGPGNCGELGDDAYRFIDFLSAAGQRVWQVLPLGPTHGDLSPYQSLSAFAGNRRLISLQRLVQWGWLESNEASPCEGEARTARMALAWQRFKQRATDSEVAEWQHFCAEARHWLDDYALYCVSRSSHQQRAWCDWPEALRWRDAAALETMRRDYDEALTLIRFEQFIFYRQWQQLRNYANQRGIELFGDMPIFVAHDSADLWANPDAFQLDEHGYPTVVAGVPPDYFSATGQRWGNPHYDWEWMESNDFEWWRARIAWQLRLFDLIRIDHFRGFESYWEIPAHEPTATNGRWVTGPGAALFARLRQEFDPLPLVAEDLGIITPEVETLRDDFQLPGMRILQFAFSGEASNPYLPHNHSANSVVYTGTHDNDTTQGWYGHLPEWHQHHMLRYLGLPGEAMPWPLIRSAYASTARLAVVPMQDLLALGSEHRMNIPGTADGNWTWRFRWEWLQEPLANRIREMTELYGR